MDVLLLGCLVPMRRMGTPPDLRCRPLQTTDINDSAWRTGCDASRMHSHAAHGNENKRKITN